MGISGAIMMGAGVVAGGISKYGSASANAKINEQNARMAEEQGLDARRRGREDVNKVELNVRQAIGTARSAYAGQGIEVDTGTAAAVTEGISWAGERDVLTVRNNAAREAWGYQVQGWNYRMGASLDRARGRAAIGETVLGVANVAYGSGYFNRAPIGAASRTPSGFGEAGNAGR